MCSRYFSSLMSLQPQQITHTHTSHTPSPSPRSPLPEFMTLGFVTPFNLTRAVSWNWWTGHQWAHNWKEHFFPAFSSKHLSREGKGPLSPSSSHAWLELMAHSWHVAAAAMDLWLGWSRLAQEAIFHRPCPYFTTLTFFLPHFLLWGDVIKDLFWAEPSFSDLLQPGLCFATILWEERLPAPFRLYYSSSRHDSASRCEGISIYSLCF